MITENCIYCNRKFKGTVGSNVRHIKACKRLHENKEQILRDYKNRVAFLKISEKYKVGMSMIMRLVRECGYVDKYSRSTLNHNFFKTKTPEMFWLLGMIASDGNIGSDWRWSIAQSGQSGFDIISYIVKLLNHSNKISSIPTMGQDSHSISLSSKEMVKDLKHYHITERKTTTLKFDYSIFDNNEEYFKSFLRGYIDGDGCVSVGNQSKIRVLFISFVGNHNFIDCISSFLPYKDFSKHKSKSVTQISYAGESAVKFCDWLYSNNTLYKHYKYQKYIDYINSDDKVRWSIYNKLYLENKHRLLTEKPWHICNDIGVSCDLVLKWKERTDNIIKVGNFYYSTR